VSYRFHQVKTRSLSKGPWRTNEFFGVPSTRGRRPAATSRLAAAKDSIFARFFDHITRFGTRCEFFVFVTDAGVTTEFDGLLSAVRDAGDLSLLVADQSLPARWRTSHQWWAQRARCVDGVRRGVGRLFLAEELDTCDLGRDGIQAKLAITSGSRAGPPAWKGPHRCGSDVVHDQLAVLRRGLTQ